MTETQVAAWLLFVLLAFIVGAMIGVVHERDKILKQKIENTLSEVKRYEQKEKQTTTETDDADQWQCAIDNAGTLG